MTHAPDYAEKYIYIPISPSSQIRILELYPSLDDSEPLHGALLDVHLDGENCIYEAISYTWGTPEFSETLLLHEAHGSNTDSGQEEEPPPKAFHITRNLHSGLLRFRDAVKVRRLWVDAVCINQSDDVEKSIQIPLMEKIYSRAKRVLVWLGSTFSLEEQHLALFSQWSRRTPRSKINASPEIQQDVEKWVIAIKQVLRLPWFTRLWIVQEAVVNVDVLLFCGREEISMFRLRSIISWFSTHFTRKQFPRVYEVRALFELWDILGLGTKMPKNAVEDRETMQMYAFEETGLSRKTTGDDHYRHTAIDLLEPLDIFRNFGCSDARDRIYALSSLIRGLSSFSRELDIQPDYTLSTEKAYIRFAQQVLLYGEIDWVLFHAAAQRGERHKTHRLPSWVPDFEVAKSMNPLLGRASLESQSSVSFSSESTALKRGKYAIRMNVGCWRTWNATFFASIRDKYQNKNGEVKFEYSTVSPTELAGLRNPKNHTLTMASLTCGWKSATFPTEHSSTEDIISWVHTLLQNLNSKPFSSHESYWRRETTQQGIVIESLAQCFTNASSFHEHLATILQEHSIETDVRLWNRYVGRSPTLQLQHLERLLADIGWTTPPTSPSTDLNWLAEFLQILLKGRCIFTCFTPRGAIDIIGIGPASLRAYDLIMTSSRDWRIAYVVCEKHYLAGQRDIHTTVYEYVGDCYIQPLNGKVLDTRGLAHEGPIDFETRESPIMIGGVLKEREFIMKKVDVVFV